MCCLEEAVIATCADFGVTAQRSEFTGVWVDGQKICALGERAPGIKIKFVFNDVWLQVSRLVEACHFTGWLSTAAQT